MATATKAIYTGNSSLDARLRRRERDQARRALVGKPAEFLGFDGRCYEATIRGYRRGYWTIDYAVAGIAERVTAVLSRADARQRLVVFP